MKNEKKMTKSSMNAFYTNIWFIYTPEGINKEIKNRCMRSSELIQEITATCPIFAQKEYLF